MKKTTTAIAMLSLTLIFAGSAFGQNNKRRAPQQIGNPFGLGGTVTAGVKNRQPVNARKRIDKATPLTNLGDTGTHEVGHVKGRRQQSQYNPKEVGIDKVQTSNLGDTGTHEVGHKGKRRSANQVTVPKLDGSGKEAARTRKPQAQNLLPYMEQSNLKRHR